MSKIALVLAVSAAVAAGGAGAAGDMDALLGKALFERDWIPAPVSTDSADGLGPLFGARSCAGCHAGEARTARFTEARKGKIAARGLVVRFGDSDGRPDPVYGRLLQNQAVEGMLPEGRAVVRSSGDGASGYELALHLNRGALDPATRRSMRLAPPLAGRALLERIDRDAVLALADPGDRDGDGVSGRARRVGEDGRLGRYGWKAANASLGEQVADAFALELGLSSPSRPLPHGDCTPLEPDCLAAPGGESERHQGNEISGEMIALVASFVASLDAPARQAGGDAGKNLFADVGCAACHVPNLPGADGEDVAAYTDLLLHDMGPALDDGVGEVGVASSEWRTAPLLAISGGDGRRYLHDGRAKNVDAAIRAHAGEAEAARRKFERLSESEKAALLAFVENL